MRKAFIVGHPIKHSRSPLIHGYWLEIYGLDGCYERVDVAPEVFGAFIGDFAERGFVGGNVTVPHKEVAFSLVDSRTGAAERIGAVNTISIDDEGRVAGDNTDAFGFIAHLNETLAGDWVTSSNGTATVIGAGGAARAIVIGLLDAGMNDIRVANRTRERAETIAELDPVKVRAIDWSALPASTEQSGMLVNTTSLGMAGQPPLTLELFTLPRNAIVADIVYAPLETDLLRRSRQRGLRTVDGLGMLLHQAVPGFERWFGIRPAITRELRDRIVADLNAA